MSFCSNCGAEVQEGQAICLGCGFALKGNAVTVDKAVETDLSDRVEHDVFKMWPTFSDGPIGRMEYLKGFLKLFAVAAGLAFLVGFTGAAGRANELMFIPFTIFAIIALVATVVIIAHQIAISYKRFWDMGFDDKGVRVGMTLGLILIEMIPIVNLLALLMFFVPGRRNQ